VRGDDRRSHIGARIQNLIGGNRHPCELVSFVGPKDPHPHNFNAQWLVGGIYRIEL
jgi:hypothetical protein